MIYNELFKLKNINFENKIRKRQLTVVDLIIQKIIKLNNT